MSENKNQIIGVLRSIIMIVIGFNKVLIPTAVIGISVMVPYSMILVWMSSTVSQVMGDAYMMLTVSAFLLLTMPIMAVMIVKLIFGFEEVVPWKMWGEH